MKKGDDVDGVMMLDKPVGMSSNHALQKVRRAINAKKAGHTGTLDPFASGLLPLCFGNATKFSQDLLNADKAYVARVRLGYHSTTGDTEGELTAHEVPSGLTLEKIDQVAQQFLGEIEQTPPMFSALKRDGRPLYEYARQGIELEVQPRKVTIKSLKVSDFDGESFTMECLVSKGTYIRVLGEDIGKALGTAAYLTALRRTKVGPLSIDDVVQMSEFENKTVLECRELLESPDYLLQGLPAVELSQEHAQRFMHGQRIHLALECRGLVRVYGKPWGLLGTAVYQDDNVLRPERLIAH